MNAINFNGATPASTYRREQTDFTYQVAVYYNDMKLVDKDGNDLYVTAYIGVKGDANLDNILDSADAAQVLAYYSEVVNGASPDEVQLSLTRTDLVTGPDSIYDHFAAFLADTDTNEWDPDNWSVRKSGRNNDSADASQILAAYTEANNGRENEMWEVWNEIVPSRFGEN
jgi:hypothetical protein